MPELSRVEPPYLQIVRHIRDDITAGRLKDGDHVPSAREIVAEWGVALATATKALTTLRTEGLVKGIPGVGTVVQATNVHRSARDYSISALRTGRIYPPGHYAKIVSSELVPAPDEIADALGLDHGSTVIRRQRTIYDADGLALSASLSWFDGALSTTAPLLLKRDRILQGTTRYVIEQTGVSRSPRERMLMAAGAATSQEAEQLGIAESAPVLRSRNWAWDIDGAVIEYGESAAKQGLETSFDYTTDEEQ
jgi:DNA-binding GntR family transcriptional regulator